MGKHEGDLRGQDWVLSRKLSQEQKNTYWEHYSPEQKLALVTHELRQRSEMTRRTALGLGIGSAVTVFLAANGLIDLDQQTRDKQARKKEENEQDVTTRLEVLKEWKKNYPAKDGEPLPDESFITVGGLGCVSSEPHARPMTKATGLPNETNTPMSFLISSLEGKTIPEVAKIIEKAAGESGSLSFYGQSNGSVVILEALHYLKNRKENPKIIPINRFILNCSPFGFDDAKVNHIEEYLSKLLVGTSYEPGMIGQFLWLLRETWTIDRQHLLESFLDSVQESWDRTQKGEPPGPWIADLRILLRSRLNKHNFKGIITENTEMLFMTSDNDDVVYNEDSVGKYRELAEEYGASFTVRPLPPGTRHGDSDRGGEIAEPWVRHRKDGLEE